MSSYSATRIKFMKAKLIKQQEYEKLLKMSEKEVIGFLQATEYRPDVDALNLKDLEDLETIDRIIARNNDRVVGKLKEISDKEFLGALQIFLQANDAWNLKLIAESISSGTDAKETLKSYAKYGTFDPVKFASAKTIEELSRMAAAKMPGLRKTPTTLTAFFDALRTTIVVTQNSEKYLIDEQNIIKLITMKRDKVPPDQIAKRLHMGGTVSLSSLRDAANAPTVSDTMKALRATKYGKIDQDSFVRFEYGLHREVLRHIRRMSAHQPLSPAVLTQYMAQKEIEIANLRLLIKGKHLGLDESFIKEQLVT